MAAVGVRARQTCIILCLLLHLQTTVLSKNQEESSDEKWKKKKIQDYNDADLERLFEQWEVS